VSALIVSSVLPAPELLARGTLAAKIASSDCSGGTLTALPVRSQASSARRELLARLKALAPDLARSPS